MRGREPARRAIVGLVFLAFVVASGRARAADIRVHASRNCADRSEIADQVDTLLGRPLAAVEGLDFDVDIAEGPQHRWRLRLATIGRADGAKRSREIDGSGCAQLADAAAVAIAMSVQSSGATEPTTHGAPTKAPAPPEPPQVVAEATPVEPPLALRFPITVAALADAGALPHTGLGFGLGVALSRGRLLITGQGAFLFSPEARVPDSAGGQFRLIVGSLLACLNHDFGPVGFLGCAGAEAGVVQAEGIGINHPRAQNVPWGAGLLELGLIRRLNATLSLFLRGGVALPWTRPTFTLNNDTLAVHRADVVSGRLTVGALFDLF